MREITVAVLCELEDGALEFRAFTSMVATQSEEAVSYILNAKDEVESEPGVRCVVAVLDPADPAFEQLKQGMEGL